MENNKKESMLSRVINFTQERKEPKRKKKQLKP